MTLWTDLFASAKVGDIQYLLAADSDPAKHLLLTESPQALSAATYAELTSRYGVTQAVWDNVAIRNVTGGYYLPGSHGSDLACFEATPGLGGGTIRMFTSAGYMESTDRGATWTHNTGAADPVAIAGQSVYGMNGNIGSVIQTPTGRLYSHMLANDFNGTGFNKKLVCYSDNFGVSWTGLWYEDGDSTTNTYIDMDWSPKLGMLAVCQYNGRVITHNGTTAGQSTWTQRKAGNGGSAPFNWSVKWIPELNSGEGAFILTSDDRIYKSVDGITWTQVMMPANCKVKSLTKYGPMGVVGFVKDNTGVQTGGASRFCYTTDGTTWTPIDLNIPYNGSTGGTITVWGCWYVNGKYLVSYTHSLADANMRMAFTSDFVNWSSMDTHGTTNNLSFASFFNDVAIIVPTYVAGQSSYNYHIGYQSGFYRFFTNAVVVPGINGGQTGLLKPYLRYAT